MKLDARRPRQQRVELKPMVESLAAVSSALLRAVDGGHGGELRGTVRVSASEVVAVHHLPPLLARLRQVHPGLTLELSPSNALDDLLQRKADIAVRMVQPEQQALVARRIGSIAVGLHARRDYLDRRGMPRTLDDLRAHDLIGYDVETPAKRAAVERYPALNRDAFALWVDGDVAQLAAIRAGFGIGFCQTILAAREPDLVRVLPEAFHLDLETWIVMHEDLRDNVSCRIVFDALVEGMTRIAARRPVG